MPAAMGCILMGAAWTAGLVLLTPAVAVACDAALQATVDQNPELTDEREALARSCARAGNPAAALAEFERLLERDANNVDWLFGMALALRALGRPREALPVLVRAKSIAPDYEDVAKAHASVQAEIEELDRRTRLSVGVSHEDLSGGRPAWKAVTATIDQRLGEHSHVFGGINVEERFETQDEQFTAGFAGRIAGDWSYSAALDLTPDAEILPEWNLAVEAGRALPGNRGISLRARHSSYDTVDVDSLAATIEQYASWLRVAYTLNAAQPTDLDWSFGHTLRISHDYGDANYMTLALGYGEEAETIAPGVVQVTRNRSASVNGLHWRNTVWGIAWEAGWYEQGDLYDRIRLRLGLEYRF